METAGSRLVIVHLPILLQVNFINPANAFLRVTPKYLTCPANELPLTSDSGCMNIKNTDDMYASIYSDFKSTHHTLQVVLVIIAVPDADYRKHSK